MVTSNAATGYAAKISMLRLNIGSGMLRLSSWPAASSEAEPEPEPEPEPKPEPILSLSLLAARFF